VGLPATWQPWWAARKLTSHPEPADKQTGREGVGGEMAADVRVVIMRAIKDVEKRQNEVW
jgi:hypothetical protein